jgi:hypothetical protein
MVEHEDVLYEQLNIKEHIDQKYAEFELWFNHLKTQQPLFKLMITHLCLALITITAWIFADGFIYKLETTRIFIVAFPILIISYLMFFYRYFTLQRMQPISRYLIGKHLLGDGGILIKDLDQSIARQIVIVEDTFEIVKLREREYIETQTQQVRADMMINLITYYILLADVVCYIVKYTATIKVILPQ